ncbi:class I SAM-dependent methyltransferase [Gordonia hongkongensis]|uniref:class I SAM-dependent methyltransferase n=1 Tax=Gordonia hongkongensis TaxID=1701090 RepID=UPI001FF89C2F|nr:class I SAM-dependent methyltransferase [Gordonia hongkongensis]UPG68973.1 methyltransferase domain-containing protein [Gordonia hongkongensis]
MTSTHHPHPTGAHHEHANHADHHNHARLAAVLELDAELMADYLGDAARLVAEVLGRVPARIADLGAGTGTGTEALARRFPHASILAVDGSSDMVALVERRAREGGFDDRVTAVVADLDDGLPPLGTPDVVWAAMSLHHVADPQRLLREAATSLGPDGIVVITEMAGVPRFVPAHEDAELLGLQDRCQTAAAGAGWEALVDWTDAFHDVDYEVLRAETVHVRRSDPSPSVARYARHWFAQFRHRLADTLDPADLALLDDLTEADARNRLDDLTLAAGRLLWVARPRTSPIPTLESEQR